MHQPRIFPAAGSALFRPRTLFSSLRLVSLSCSAALMVATLSPSRLAAQVADDEGSTEAAVEQSAEKSSIEGRVFNLRTNLYINRAQVEILGSSRRAFTNQFGEFELYGLEPGKYTIRVTFTGLASQTRSVEVAGGETAQENFYLNEEVIGQGAGAKSEEDKNVFELEEFEVKASESFQDFSELALQEERFSPNLKNVVATDAYGIIAQGNVGEFVKFVPGVQVEYGGTYSSGADATQIQIRGFSAEQTQITMDGIPISNAQPGTLSPAVGLDMLSINNASRVEVIKVPTADQPAVGLGGTVNLVSKTAFEYPKPTFRLRTYFSGNSENLDFFSKTPGPMAEKTYKTRPSFEMSFAYPINDWVGFSLNMSAVSQANENHTIKTSWRSDPDMGRPDIVKEGGTVEVDGYTYPVWIEEDPRFSTWQQAYGSDWKEWYGSLNDAQKLEMFGHPDMTDEQIVEAYNQVKWIPVYENGEFVGAQSPNDVQRKLDTLPIWYDDDGNPVGPVFFDAAHPWLNNISVTDSPRTSERRSASLKFDFRPLDGMVATLNYQVSTFSDQDAGRRFTLNAGTGNTQSVAKMGNDFIISRDGAGTAGLDLDALDRDGETQSGYFKVSYIKGPWDIRGYISYSSSTAKLVSVENGHFSQMDLKMGGIDRAEIRGFADDGLPDEVVFYRYVTDENGDPTGEEIELDPADLSNYAVSGIDQDDPQASRLRVKAGNTESQSTITASKFDVRRDLDFIPGDFMNLAIKVGGDYEKREESKSGRGTGYVYQYVGESGVTLNLDDFKDEYYVNVDPGFGFTPREWPDLSKLYGFFLDHPESFSDTYDTRFIGTDGNPESGNTAAAQNWVEYFNTNKAVTETKTSYYAQIEGEFFNNRLTIVAGARYEEKAREGRLGYKDNNWARLRFDDDANGDKIRDVARNILISDYSQAQQELFSLLYPDGEDALEPFVITSPPKLGDALAEFGLNNEDLSQYSQLPAEFQNALRTLWGMYEEAGLVYADGRPFTVDGMFDENGNLALVQENTLQAVKMQYLPDYEVDENSKGRLKPVISAAFDLTDNWMIRASWAKQYSNPPYEGDNGILRQTSYNEDDMVLTTNNPNIKTASTNQYDLGVAYFSDSGGKFALNSFFSIEENSPISVSYTPGANRDKWEQILRELGYDENSQYWRDGWKVNTSVNASSTYFRYGYELEVKQQLSVLGDWGKYFYVYGSISHQFESRGSINEEESDQSVFEEPVEPKLFASGGLSITYKRFRGLFNFTWENKRVTGYDEVLIWADPTVGNAAWYGPLAATSDELDQPYLVQVKKIQPEDFRLDVTLSYRMTDHLTLDFSARNVTNSRPYDRLEGPGLPVYRQETEASNYGVNFTFGVTASY